ncbi:MAG: electron transport complex subunit RsxC [Gammaproteobacteria bacterium]|nr:electron transport complex subunit RsxC [Gammaproteobacteria bacterium]
MHTPTVKQHARQLWRFHGGLHLPDNKALSLQRPLRTADLPDRLVLPLQQHIGEPAEPLVRVGDSVLKGQKIADNPAPVSSPVHAPTSGRILEISDQPVPHPSGLPGPCIIIEPDGQDRWATLPEPITDYRSASAGTLRTRIRESGIVGMGGATFPSAIKLNPGKPIKTLIINGAECEPYITCDDLLMQTYPERVLEGARILLRLLDAEECLIAVEDNKPSAISILHTHLQEQDRIEVVSIPTLYPSGGEKQLIRILTGLEVPSSGYPAQLGIVCHNVATTAAIADAVLEGKPLISRIVTLTGDGIAEPCNIETPLGIPASDLVVQAAGYTDKVSQLILGGPMMGFDLPTDQIPITKGANCLLAVSEAEAPPTGATLACIRCGRCAEACPAKLLPQQMYWYSRAKDLEKAQDYNLFDCIECGCCSHVCPSHIPLVQYFRYAKTESWAKEKERREAEHAKQRHEFRIARLERLEAERKARLRKKKADLKKKPARKKASGSDGSKKAAIEAALQRAAAKKAQRQTAPKNTQNLTAAQQAQIEAADQRRAEQAPPANDTIREEKE